MTSKRFFGYMFLVLAILLSLAVLGQLPEFIAVMVMIFNIFTGTLTSAQIGEAIGHGIYWVIHFILTIALWKFGIKWSKKKPNVS